MTKLLSVMDDWIDHDAMEGGHSIDVINTDYHKAFDSVSH